MIHLFSRRLVLLGVHTLLLGAAKVTEDVLGRESGLFDRVLLWLVRDWVPRELTGWFEVITASGSVGFLSVVTVIGVAVLLILHRRNEAVLLGASVLLAAMLVYTMKVLVGRTRPTLWQADWYWGSSFPSGHTLCTTAFAVAAALCTARGLPRAAAPAIALAGLWSASVAMSRLVLGAHWPTDVLAALCLAALLPLLVSAAQDLRHHARAQAFNPPHGSR